MLSPFPPKATLSPLSGFFSHACTTNLQPARASTWSFGGSHRSSVEIINPSLTVNVSLVKRLTLTACSNHQHVFSCIPWLWLLYTHTVLALTQKNVHTHLEWQTKYPQHSQLLWEKKNFLQQRIIIPLYQKQIEVIHHTCEMHAELIQEC